VELLIHIGLETVAMEGEGFTAHVKEGDKVKVGDPLITCDLELIKEKASSTITPIVIMNGDVLERVTKHEEAKAKKSETKLMELKVK